MTCEFGKYFFQKIFVLCENCCEKIIFPKGLLSWKFSQKQKESGDFRENKTNLDDFSKIFAQIKIFAKNRNFSKREKNHFRFNPISTLTK